MSKMMRFLPLVFMVALGVVLAIGMFKHGQQNPIDIRHDGEKIANFSVPLLNNTNEDNTEKFSPEIFAGNVAMINVFASWCEGCLAEHKALMKLADSKKVKIYGLAWKDKPEKISNYLNKNGNPFQKVGVDTTGETTLALALTGVPETFIVDKNGAIAFHYKSALTDEIIENTILPLLEKLNYASPN